MESEGLSPTGSEGHQRSPRPRCNDRPRRFAVTCCALQGGEQPGTSITEWLWLPGGLAPPRGERQLVEFFRLMGLATRIYRGRMRLWADIVGSSATRGRKRQDDEVGDRPLRISDSGAGDRERPLHTHDHKRSALIARRPHDD
jgi:hypothetical protein